MKIVTSSTATAVVASKVDGLLIDIDITMDVDIAVCIPT